MTARALHTAAVLLLLAATAAPAEAYSDLSRFDEASGEGGGGGRYFTGSPADGYTCVVCHLQGGAEKKQQLELVIGSLPSEYEPGRTYDVMVTWAEGIDHVSAAVEFTDGDGRGAGDITLPRGKVLTQEDQCQPFLLPIPAAMRIDLAEGRQVIGLADCGARRIAFQWRAPAEDVGAIWFSGAIVRSSNTSDMDGDGVTPFRRTIPREGTSVAETTSGGCTVVDPGRAAAPEAVLLAFAIALCAFTRSWRRRRV